MVEWFNQAVEVIGAAALWGPPGGRSGQFQFILFIFFRFMLPWVTFLGMMLHLVFPVLSVPSTRSSVFSSICISRCVLTHTCICACMITSVHTHPQTCELTSAVWVYLFVHTVGVFALQHLEYIWFCAAHVFFFSLPGIWASFTLLHSCV